MSVGLNGAQGNAGAYSFSLMRPVSADGRFIAFGSDATNLVLGDVNGFTDVFIRDRLSATTELVSLSSTGIQGNGLSGINRLSISADGNFVAFESSATNMVPNDTNGWADVFVRDRSTGITERVSESTLGLEADHGAFYPTLSADGRFVAFFSFSTNLVAGDSNNLGDCFVRDRASGATERVSVATGGAESNGESTNPAISADGRYIVFASLASNLVSGDTNGAWDTFVHDRLAGTTARVSVDSNGLQANGASQAGYMSDDDRFVVFGSDASNLVLGDTNGCADAFVRDLLNGITDRVSVSTGGNQSNGWSNPFSISADGRFVGFGSLATNLVAGDSNGVGDVFVRDRLFGTTDRESIATNSSEGNGPSTGGWLTPDGRFVVMYSVASNIVPGDTNGVRDAFIRDRFAAGFTSICDPGAAGVLACPCNNSPSNAGRGCDNSSFTGGAALSADGIAYLSMDSLVFHTTGEKPSATSILLQGDASLPAGIAFGQGVRCAAGTLKRLYLKTAFSGSISAPDFSANDPSISARSAALGMPLQPGQGYAYLVYYRDPIVLGGCPAISTFNCTQTGTVTYWP